MSIKSDHDFYYSNGYENASRIGDSPGCTTSCGDGTFTGCTTGCTTQCPGCDGEWCCDCDGCRPGRCDETPVNQWCQDWFDTYGWYPGSCLPPNTDPCYEADPIRGVLVPRTDSCYCPGYSMPAGNKCNPDGTTTQWGDPSPDTEEDETESGPGITPVTGGNGGCYLTSRKLFGDGQPNSVPCHCLQYIYPDAYSTTFEISDYSYELLKCCIFEDCPEPVYGCECGSIQINNGPIEVTCGETINGNYTGNECEVECHCHDDCDAGETCNSVGQCV